MTTELIPAIDLLEGKVVRLLKGDYEKAQFYHVDALKKLKEYEESGAKWLHIVDLSGAKNPHQRQIALINELCAHLFVNLQVGGGVRNEDEIKALVKAGVKRVVIGSLAVKDPDLVASFLKEFSPDNLTIALDVLPNADKSDYFIATDAWQEKSDKSLLSVLDFYANLGARNFLCTDISKDGTMSGANLELYSLINRIFPELDTQASGGVSNLADLQNLNGVVSGIIVGKALLDGVFSVKEGIKCLQSV